MGGVDVVAQPEARVGEADRGPPAACSASASNARPSGRPTLLELERRRRRRAARRSSQGSIRWWSWLPGTITSSPPGDRAGERGDRRAPRPRATSAQRAVAKLEHVAEQHQPVDALERARAAAARKRSRRSRSAPLPSPRCRSEITAVRTGGSSQAGPASRRRSSELRRAVSRERLGQRPGDQVGARRVALGGEVDAVVDEPVVLDVGGPVVDAHVRVALAGVVAGRRSSIAMLSSE